MCEIKDVRIVGAYATAAGVPKIYAIFAQVQDCEAVSITIETLTGSLLLSASPVDVTGMPVDTQGNFEFRAVVEFREDVTCDEEVVVRIVCFTDKTCRFEGTLPVVCEVAAEECDKIKDVRIVGKDVQKLTHGHYPLTVELVARIHEDCNLDYIKIVDINGEEIFLSWAVDATGSPVDAQGFLDFTMPVEYSRAVTCDEKLFVVISCDHGSCQFKDILPVECGPPDDDGKDRRGFCVISSAFATGALILALVLVLLALCGVPVDVTVITALVAVSLGAFLLLSILCGWGYCEIVGAIAWCFMWGAIIGVVIALICVSLMVLLLALGYGMIAGFLVLWLWDRSCPTPHLLSAP